MRTTNRKRVQINLIKKRISLHAPLHVSAFKGKTTPHKNLSNVARLVSKAKLSNTNMHKGRSPPNTLCTPELPTSQGYLLKALLRTKIDGTWQSNTSHARRIHHIDEHLPTYARTTKHPMNRAPQVSQGVLY